MREQILQAVAVIFKRGTVESKENGREGLFADISQIITSGDPSLVSSCHGAVHLQDNKSVGSYVR